MRRILYPKLFTTLQNYSRHQFLSDLMAGMVVGIVAIPLAIAFGIASGVTPAKGIITAIVAGFLISFLGGSRVQIGGPTGAFIVIVYGIVQKYGVEGLTLATLMAGAMLIVMGAAGLGTVIEFIPYPVIVGFTSGIAVIIFSSQVKDFLGLAVGTVPAEFVEKWRLYFENFGSVNFYALAVGLGTVAILALWPKVSKKIPGSVVAILLFSSLAVYFHWPVETIGSRFGELPRTLPMPQWPSFHLSQIQPLIQPAFTIALLAGIESLLSAVVADGMIGSQHRCNMELVAQGIANMASSLFGGIPATGAIARTATNIKNGGRTPVAGIVHALTVLLMILFLAPWVKLIPMACLAGILVIVAYHMSEWHSFLWTLKGPRGSVGVLLVTFFLTVFTDLTLAIEIGMVLSAFLFMRRMALTSHIQIISKESETKPDISEIDALHIPEGAQVYDINGPFFFAVSQKFIDAMRQVARKPKVRILRLKNAPFIDSTGLNSLRQFHRECERDHVALILSDVHPGPRGILKNSGFLKEIGEENVFSTTKDALSRARAFIGNN